MRTTLTLDPDVAAKLQAQAEKQRRTFKEVVNDALRLGLDAGKGPRKPNARHRLRTFQAEFLPHIDPHKLNQLADELQTEAAARTLRR